MDHKYRKFPAAVTMSPDTSFMCRLVIARGCAGSCLKCRHLLHYPIISCYSGRIIEKFLLSILNKHNHITETTFQKPKLREPT